MNMTADVGVIGGGIVGTVASLLLAERGHTVVLLERDVIAGEASGVNMGGLGGAGPSGPDDIDGTLRERGFALFQELQMGRGRQIEFRESGTLQAIANEAEWAFAEALVAASGETATSLELLSGREVRSIEPAFSAALPGALLAARGRGEANPALATVAFGAEAAAAGVIVRTGATVTALESGTNGIFTIAVADGERISAGALVLAAGAWCGPLGKMLGLDVPVVPVRGQMWATERLAPRVFHTIAAMESPLAWHNAAPVSGEPPALTHRDGMRVTRHLYGRQTADGEVIFGGDRELLGFDKTIAAAGIAVNKGQASEVLPFLRDLPVSRTWSGLMPFTLDGAPLIGALPGHRNLWIAGGLASSGFGRGPGAAAVLVDLMESGGSGGAADPTGRVTVR